MKAIIFDLDGVIVFTDRYHYLAWKQMADSMNIYFDETINNRLRGVSRMESLAIILERYQGETLTEEQKNELACKKNEIYRKLLANMKPEDVSTQVRDTLVKLRERGIKLAIGSSSKNAGLILERVDLTDAFDKISDGTNITKSKPDPEVFLKAAEYLEEDPADCLIVEDAEAGIAAGIAAGMKTAAIGEAVKTKKADYNLNAIKDLLDIFQ